LTPQHATIYGIRLVKEVDVTYTIPNKHPITSTQEAASLCAQILAQADREHFLVCLFNVKRRLIGVHTAHIGTLTASVVHPREVFKAAILANADSVILAHNHPSGDVLPSREDIAITKRLRHAGSLLGIQVIDHIIVGFPAESTSHVYYSFAEENGLQ